MRRLPYIVDMKPSCRHTMSKVRSIAHLLLLMCFISMACHNFGNHDFMPLDVSCFDYHSRIDLITFIGMGNRTVLLMEDPVPVTALVTPCGPAVANTGWKEKSLPS